MTDQTSPIDAAAIDAEADYRIVIARPVTVAGIKLRPRGDITLRGDILKTLITETPDVVLSIAAVA
ncbi:conserved hypothetical protein [uncultured Pleomorphomonas sp.]|uniref:Uncharacterized protein n=1 Tax=uncultured Pleomorphomonas sp. TaxID=442121 RepID=A0A212LR64_9HYPH|nr:hypothetical protein [uncultured Pleomorphomonas sp.]SCM79981.1 conserved hypothetical protein [uncultured Pleomorphomonas sp.]